MSHLTFGTVGSQLLVAATFALIARSSGPEIFGLLSALLGLASVGQDLADFGTSQWISREMAAGRLSSEDAQRILRRRSALIALIAVLGTAVCALAGVNVLMAAAVAVYAVAAVVNAGAHARLRASGDFARSSAHLVGERVACLTWAYLAVSWRPPTEAAAEAFLLGFGICLAGSGLVARQRSCQLIGADPVLLKQAYRRASGYGVLGLASDLQQMDVAIVAWVGSLAAAAEVGLASKLTGPVALLAGVVSQVVARSVSIGGDQAASASRTALRLSCGLGAGLLVALPLIPRLAIWLLGSAYAQAGPVIVVYMLGAALAVVNQALASILAAAGRDRVVAVTVGIAVVSGLVIGAALVEHLGAVGMGVGYVFTQLAILGACVRLRRSHPRHSAVNALRHIERAE